MFLPSRFDNLTKEELYQLYSNKFLISEINQLIDETPLTDLDREIARLKYTRLKTNEEIASMTGRDVKTISNHLVTISKKIRTTITRLPKEKH